MSPVLFWHDIIYLPKEHYFYVPFTNSRGILWLFVNVYGNPLLLLSFIYLRITLFLRRQPNNNLILIKKRQERDLVVIRRIFITVGLLMALGIPALVLLIMLHITGEENPLIFRIGWIPVCLSMIGLSLSMVLFTPQLKRIISKKLQNNRVRPHDDTVEDSIAIRCNTIT